MYFHPSINFFVISDFVTLVSFTFSKGEVGLPGEQGEIGFQGDKVPLKSDPHHIHTYALSDQWMTQMSNFYVTISFRL